MAAVAMVMEEGKEHGGGFALDERGGGFALEERGGGLHWTRGPHLVIYFLGLKCP